MLRQAPLLWLLIATTSAASPVDLKTAGSWQSFGDLVSSTKLCGEKQVTAIDGVEKQFALYAESSTQGVLHARVKSASWNILSKITAPITITFPTRQFSFVGVGEEQTISFDVNTSDLKDFIHHFTADGTMVVSFPQGRELPWTLDLTGTTPTVDAMAKCAETALISLPPPFTQIAETQNANNHPSPEVDADANLSSDSTPLASSPSPVDATVPDNATGDRRFDPSAPAGLTPPKQQTSESTPAAGEPAISHHETPDGDAISEPAPPSQAAGAPVETNDGVLRTSSDDAAPSVSDTVRRNSGLAFGGIGLVVIVFVSIAATLLYFVPLIVAVSRKIQHPFWLGAVNLLFGWTVFGWIGCVVWAACAQSGKERLEYEKLLLERQASLRSG